MSIKEVQNKAKTIFGGIIISFGIIISLLTLLAGGFSSNPAWIHFLISLLVLVISLVIGFKLIKSTKNK